MDTADEPKMDWVTPVSSPRGMPETKQKSTSSDPRKRHDSLPPSNTNDGRHARPKHLGEKSMPVEPDQQPQAKGVNATTAADDTVGINANEVLKVQNRMEARLLFFYR